MSAITLTTEEAFLESVLHDEHIILGRVMQPFCVEMWCILKALESPLVDGGDITITDMQLAVIACSTPSVGEFYRLTRRPGFFQQLWMAYARAARVNHVLAQFNRYIDDYVPQFPRSEGVDGGCAPEFKCPELFLCAARLFAAGHSDHEVCRVIPLGKLLSWGLAMGEREGDPLEHILNLRQIEAAKQIDAMLEAQK